MLLVFIGPARIIWSVALVYSLSDQLVVNKTTYEDKAFTLCTGLNNCLKSCRNSSVLEAECQWPSQADNISACACSDLHCSRLKSLCLLSCKGGSTVSEECVECLLHNDSDACAQTCTSSGTCTLREECDDAFCRACAPGFFGTRCNETCAGKCRGRCFRDSGYCYRCERGKFGRGCEQNCSAHCHRNSCSPQTGLCRSCAPGYVGTTCNQTCPKGYFGLKCFRPCSANCLNATCDHATGRCLHGCVPGFFNVFCDKMCPGGNYGAGCLANCPVTCAAKENRSPCDHATGACLNGCNEGFRSEQCNKPCMSGQFGRNCERNCSGQCFLQVCNSFSGHCLRCEAGRDGPFCEDIKAMAAKASNPLDTDVSTDQVILIFITLFVVGGCLWLTFAGSMYHRRKLMWQKIWKTGKLPAHYRLPRIWKQTLVRASISPVQRYHSVRRYISSLEASRAQRRKDRRKGLVSSDSSDESNTSSEALTSVVDEQVDAVRLSSKDKDLKDVGQGGGDAAPEVPLSVDNTVMPQENVADGAKLETHPRTLESAEIAEKPLALALNTHPWSKNFESRVMEDSGASSTAKLTSNTVQVGTGSQVDIRTERPLRLLRATTRTSAVKELESSTVSYSSTTKETRTSTSARLSAPRIDSETANDTTALTESETNRSTETDTEVETTSESGTLSETSHSSAPASTSTAKSKSVEVPIRSKATKESQRIHSPLLIIDKLESSRSKQLAIPRPTPPPYHSKPPTPTKPQGLFRKGFKFLSNMIPIKVTGQLPKKELSPRITVTDKAHMSSRFLLTRLDDWRRTREKQLEIKEGFVEVSYEKKMATREKSSTLSSSVSNATTTPKLNTSATSSTRLSGETEPTTGRSSGDTTTTWGTTTSTVKSSSERPSWTSQKSSTSSSSRTHRYAGRKLPRINEHDSRTTSRTSTLSSSLLASRTASKTYSSSPSTQIPKTTSSTEPSTGTEPKESSRGSTTESIPYPKRLSPSLNNPATQHTLKKDLMSLSAAFPKTPLKDLHKDAMEKLASLEAPRGENRAQYGRRRRQKERSEVISYHGARKPVKRFRENTSPTLGVSSSTQNVSRTIGNQSTVPSSFSTGSTTETGS